MACGRVAWAYRAFNGDVASSGAHALGVGGRIRP